MRVVDDVDSSFYKLKYNVMLYINGIIEGHDSTIIEFMASNFSVNKIFVLLMRLVKKLYIRQNRIKNRTIFRYRRVIREQADNLVTEEEETLQENRIESTKDLLAFYKTYKSTFSDHAIMDVVVLLYSFMRDMSVLVVRYKSFLEEINDIREQYFGRKKRSNKINYDNQTIMIWNFVHEIIVNIEIIYKDRNWEEGKPLSLKLHYFKKIPICFFLTNGTKSKFKNSVSIESIQMKHEEFFDEVKHHTILMKDLQKLYKKSQFLSWISTESAFKIYQRILYIVALTLNIIFLLYFKLSVKKTDDSQSDTTVQVEEGFVNKLIKNWVGDGPKITLIFAAIDVFLSFMFLVLWLCLKYPTLHRIKWKEYYSTSGHSKTKKPSILTKLHISLWVCLFKKGAFRTFAIHILCCLLALTVSPYFYSMILLTIIDISMIVSSVAMSFITNYDKLAITLVMIAIIINFFSYVASNYYNMYFDATSDKALMCATYFSCFMNSMNAAFRAGGGMADLMTLNADNTNSGFGGRFIFDVLFFILINVILIGIFFGIIVDSFKEYRNNLVLRQKDEEEICFTCGLDSNAIEKAGVQFQEHLEYHDVWNYLFYIIYLKWKPVTMYDGVDLYVDGLYKSGNKNAWFPIGRTIALEEKSEGNVSSTAIESTGLLDPNTIKHEYE